MTNCKKCGFILPPKQFDSTCTFKHMDFSLKTNVTDGISKENKSN